ncbi:YrhA family protein [Erwinia tracheiphila]|nr:YrhA family protein [Erwinia tracheiphila]UIA92993.1 YrhA family protein [Erwinia tracheiphila]
MINRPDYSEMFSVMDGLEYNGLTLYSVVQAENGQPLWSNIYIRNVEARDNQIYVDPNLADGVLIGEDGMSLFTYHLTEDCFQILDKASTEYIIESHQDFSGFLSAIIDIVN